MYLSGRTPKSTPIWVIPRRKKLQLVMGQAPGPDAPTVLIAPIQNSKIPHASLIQERTIFCDFDQSYLLASPPLSYKPGTLLNYQSLEVRFEGHAAFEADIWSLGCAIFEIRAGFAFFEPILGSGIDILRQTVETLGRLPDPWWGTFIHRSLWFEDGQPKNEQDQERAGLLLKSYATSIRTKLLRIGELDIRPFGGDDDGLMMEKHGTRLPDAEVGRLTDFFGEDVEV